MFGFGCHIKALFVCASDWSLCRDYPLLVHLLCVGHGRRTLLLSSGAPAHRSVMAVVGKGLRSRLQLPQKLLLRRKVELFERLNQIVLPEFHGRPALSLRLFFQFLQGNSHVIILSNLFLLDMNCFFKLLSQRTWCFFRHVLALTRKLLSVLVALPNHSFHFDFHVLYFSVDRVFDICHLPLQHHTLLFISPQHLPYNFLVVDSFLLKKHLLFGNSFCYILKMLTVFVLELFKFLHSLLLIKFDTVFEVR